MANTLLASDLVALGLDEENALQWQSNIHLWMNEGDAAQCWQKVTQQLLTPAVPFAIHQHVFDTVFAAWPQSAGPRPAWLPGTQELQHARAAGLLREFQLASVTELAAFSVDEPHRFWSHVLSDLGIVFEQAPDSISELQEGAQNAQWLSGARLNIVESCFQAPAKATAIVWKVPGQAPTIITYGQLKQQVAQVATALQAYGFFPGDALAINMPMIPQSIAIYLGIVAAGMVVVSIADSMAPAEVSTRLRIANAKGIFTVLCVHRAGKQLPHYEKILQASPPVAIVLHSEKAELRKGDLRWESFVASAPAGMHFESHISNADRTTNILFSSGTTGEPKAIPWTQLAPIKAAMDGAYHLDIQQDDVVAWPTNLGWMMGPWLIYAALINKACIALYSDAPTTREFGQFIQEANVSVLGLVPSIVKVWRSDNRMAGLDWSRLKCFGSTGEASNADDYLYLMMLAGYRPIIEYCGGTEIGGAYITGTLLQAASPATFTTPAFGSRFVLLNENHAPTLNGEVFLVSPSLGYSQSLLNRDHHEAYFQSAPRGPQGELLRRHGDQIEQLPGGFYRAHGRMDDTMNLGGIKVSSAEIERVLDGVPGISRSAAVAVSPQGGGPSLLVIFAVASANEQATELQLRLQDAIKHKLNPLFRIHDLVLLSQLPVTASNKIMRRELRAQYRHLP